MKRLYLLLALLFLVSFSSPQIQVIDKKWYRVGYSEALEEPIWIEYSVLCTETKFSRKGLDFYTEPGVKTSDAKDYAENQWDKGHMAPAADFACDSIALRATFSYVNCALQQENLNRGVWRHLETRERTLAQSHSVKVRIEVDVDLSCSAVPGGARIPRAFRKKIYYSDQVEEYYFLNVKPMSSDPTRYRVSVK